MKKCPNKDGMLTIGGLMLLVVGFILGIYLPGKQEAEELRKEIQSTQHEIDQMPLRMAEINHLSQKIEEQKLYLESVEPRIPSHPDVDEVLRQVALLAQQSRLNLSRVEPLPTEPQNSYQAIPFRLTFRGEFSGVMQFLQELESLNRLFILKDCSLISGKEAGSLYVEGTAGFTVYARIDSQGK